MNEKYEVLDEDWINEFEKTDKLFRDFYLDDIYYTEVHFIYINTSNDIENSVQYNSKNLPQLLSGSPKLN